MTLTFQGYDQSQEVSDFIANVRNSQGFVSGVRYPRGHNATIELTAHVHEQPELIKIYDKHNGLLQSFNHTSQS